MSHPRPSGRSKGRLSLSYLSSFRGPPHAFVEVSDVNALHDSLQAAGAHVWQAPRDEPWAMRSLIVRDPDGNLICFASN